MRPAKLYLTYPFRYGKNKFRGDAFNSVSVTMEKKENDYVFHRIKRNTDAEKKYSQNINKTGLPLRGFALLLRKLMLFPG